MGFPKQEDWIRLPCPLLGYLPDPGIKPVSPELAGECFSTVPSGHLRMHIYISPNVTIWTHIGNQLGLVKIADLFSTGSSRTIYLISVTSDVSLPIYSQI